jgi:hypothetical protein
MSTTIVYRCPGRHLITNGITFDALGIELVDLDKALSEGWHETVPKAIEALTPPPQVVTPQAEPSDTAPPTRDEMLEQADKLKIQVDKRWSDATLLKKINEAMT